MKFKESEFYLNYTFEKDELNKMKIDINFYDPHITQRAVQWTKEYLFKIPEIRPLTQTLKRIIQERKLNESYKGRNNQNNLGGLSSYSILILLIVCFLQAKIRKNLGELIEEYFEKYSKFDFSSNVIDITNPLYILY